jgi:hypothetical protein
VEWTAERQKRNREKRRARAAIGSVASGRRTITYSDLLREMESSATPNSRYLTEILCELSAASLSKQGVLASAVVVHRTGKNAGIPGDGFFEFARTRGFDFEDAREFWRTELEKVFEVSRA